TNLEGKEERHFGASGLEQAMLLRSAQQSDHQEGRQGGQAARRTGGVADHWQEVYALLVILAFHPPLPGVNRRNLKRIQNGMTEKQIREILGGPSEAFYSIEIRDGERARIWREKRSRSAGIIVYFDTHDRAYKAFAFPDSGLPP